MINRTTQFREMYDELINLRNWIRDLTDVTENILTRLEHLEKLQEQTK